MYSGSSSGVLREQRGPNLDDCSWSKITGVLSLQAADIETELDSCLNELLNYDNFMGYGPPPPYSSGTTESSMVVAAESLHTSKWGRWCLHNH